MSQQEGPPQRLVEVDALAHRFQLRQAVGHGDGAEVHGRAEVFAQGRLMAGSVGGERDPQDAAGGMVDP